jgi:hypothetical protein
MATASQIRTIYSTLATKTIQVESSVAYGTTTPQIFDLNALPDYVDSAKLPCRLLLPFGTAKAEGRDVHFIALGNTAKATWHVIDLLLWRPVEEGIGVNSVAADLMTYCAQYVAMLRANRSLVSQTVIKSVNLTPDTWEYPLGSGVFYWGVECALDIDEVLSG